MTDPTGSMAASPLIAYGVPFLSAILGSAVGGVTTWLTAGRKLARERTFERQLEWHEKMFRALNTAGEQILVAMLAYTNGPPEAINTLLEVVPPALAPVKEYRAEARLFGSPAVVLKLNASFEERAMRLRDAITRHNALDANSQVSATFMSVSDLRNALLEASELLATSHRRHLGLKRLIKPAVPPIQLSLALKEIKEVQ